MRSRWARLDGPGRLAGLDLARGSAVLGMLVSHLLTIEPWDSARPETWLDIANGRSSILFATLAGVSIALVTGGRTPVRGAARMRASGRLALRAGAVWVIGVLLVASGVPVFVILPAYAALFLLSLPFLGLRAPMLFVIAAAVAVVMPFVQAFLDALPFWSTGPGELVGVSIGWAYPFPTWIAFLLAGMALGRSDLRSLSLQGVLLAGGAAVATVTAAVAVTTGSDPVAERSDYLASVWTARAHSTGLLEVIGSDAFAIAVIAGCLLLCRTPLRWAALPLRAVGSMPLTAYAAQLAACAVWAGIALGTTSELYALRALEPFWPITLGIVVGCVFWALFVGRGPLEAAVDRTARWLVREPEPAARASEPPR